MNPASEFPFLFILYAVLNLAQSETSQVKVLSLVPFLKCNLNPQIDDQVDFLRNYVEPNSLCTLAEAAQKGLNEGVAGVTKSTGIKIDIVHKQTQCQVDEGTRQLFQFFATYSMSKKGQTSEIPDLFIIGPLCPAVTRQIAAVLNYFNHTQILYGVSVPEFSETTYPRVRRIIPGFTQLAFGFSHLMKQYNWEQVAIICQQPDPFNVFLEIQNSLRTLFVSETKYKFQTFPLKTFQDALDILQQIKEMNLRIVIGLFDMDTFLDLFLCLASEMGLMTSRYQWIFGSINLASSYQNRDTCGEFLRKNSDSLASSLDENIRPEAKTHISELLVGSFLVNIHENYQVTKQSAYENRSESKLIYQYAYESVQYIAQMHNEGHLGSSHDNRVNSNYGHEMFTFGDGGEISDNDRAGQLDIIQFDHVAYAKLVGIFSTRDQSYLNISEPFWKSGKPPNDSPKFVDKVTHVKGVFYLAMCIASSAGMVLSIIFLVFNVRNRHIRFIKMSSPNLNNVIIVGCLLSYVSVFFLGFDSNVAENILNLDSYNAVCSIRAWCLTSAFTLSYGSMFSKTWRVHQIFTNVKMKKKVIKDYQLFVVIVFFLFVDILLLISWELLDPMKITRTQFATVSISADEEHILFSDKCTCKHMAKWLALLYGYKGLTMLFGCFLAWETRSVTIPALNDSKYIGINVYVVMLVCLVSIGVTAVIEDADHSFILVSTLIIFATTITLCLVFVPKLVQFKKVDPNQRQKFSIASNAKKKVTNSAARTQAAGPSRPKNGVSKTGAQPVSTKTSLKANCGETATRLSVEKTTLATKRSNATLNVPSGSCTPSGDPDGVSLQVHSSSSGETSQRNLDQIQASLDQSKEKLRQVFEEVESIKTKLETYFGDEVVRLIEAPTKTSQPNCSSGDLNIPCSSKQKSTVTVKLSFLDDVEVFGEKQSSNQDQET